MLSMLLAGKKEATTGTSTSLATTFTTTINRAAAGAGHIYRL
jgi:hypothetical protein